MAAQATAVSGLWASEPQAVAGLASPQAEGVGDGDLAGDSSSITSGTNDLVVAPQEDEVGDEQTVRTSHYTCLEENWGGAHYCGLMGCAGEQVRPGAVACPSWRCGQTFIMGGHSGVCADTGSAPIEAGEVIDWWCYSFFHWGWPGTPEYDIACPTFADWEKVTWLPK